MKPPPARGGFTIVEVVVAMGILLLGMTSILGLLSFGAALARSAALRTSAAAAVEAVTADLEESLFPLIVDERTGAREAGEPHVLERRDVPGHPGIRYDARVAPVRRKGEAAGSEPSLYRVDVDISWTASGSRRSKSFTTLLARQVPFGERLRREFVQRDLDPLKNASRETAPDQP